MFTSPRTALSVMVASFMLAFIPLAALALEQTTSVASEAATQTDISTHDRVINATETGNSTHKRLSQTKALGSSDTSAVDLDSNLSTSPAPLGGNNKSDLGVGVEARMPGASGR